LVVEHWVARPLAFTNHDTVCRTGTSSNTFSDAIADQYAFRRRIADQDAFADLNAGPYCYGNTNQNTRNCNRHSNSQPQELNDHGSSFAHRCGNFGGRTGVLDNVSDCDQR
jgi:hypothetical protein